MMPAPFIVLFRPAGSRGPWRAWSGGFDSVLEARRAVAERKEITAAYERRIVRRRI